MVCGRVWGVMLIRSSTGPIVKRNISSIGGNIASKLKLAGDKFVTKWNLKLSILWMNMNDLSPRRVNDACSKSLMYRMFILRVMTIIVNCFSNKNSNNSNNSNHSHNHNHNHNQVVATVATERGILL